jgi:hypothetical protein
MGTSSGEGLELIFSLRNGEVWFSRLDDRTPILLGPHDGVTAAMQDFIHQGEFAERLLNKAARDARI